MLNWKEHISVCLTTGIQSFQLKPPRSHPRTRAHTHKHAHTCNYYPSFVQVFRTRSILACIVSGVAFMILVKQGVNGRPQSLLEGYQNTSYGLGNQTHFKEIS